MLKLKQFGSIGLLGVPLSVVLVCVSVLVAGLSWQVLSHIEGKTEDSVANVLQASLQHTHDEISAWVHSRQEDARSWGESAALREKTQMLMDLPPEQRQQSAVQDEIWALLAPMVDRLGYRGVTIVNSHRKVVSSLESYQIGRLHPMSQQDSAFERVFQGQAVMGNPLKIDAAWSDSGYPHTMFVAAPMRDDEGGMMVAVIFEIDPEGDFSAIAAHGRIGDTGETWFFDRHGWLLSISRFEEKLHASGVLQANESSLLGVQTQLSQAELSALTSEALYMENNYQNKRVAAVRVWDENLNFGLMTSIEIEEAFAPFYRTKNLVLATVFLIVALLLTLSVFVWLVQQRRRQASEASSLQLRAVLDASPDAILLFDEVGKMIDLNSQASRLFQCPEHEVAQSPFERLQVLTPEYVQRAKGGIEVNIEDELLLGNGLIQPVGIRLRQLSEHHKNGCVLAIIQDLTARKHAEDEQQRLEQAQRLESLGVLAGGVAHDFNNILMTVIGNTALIRGRLQDDRSTTNLDRIESASRRAADLCKQMLAYSGQGQFVVQAVDLSEQLQDIRKLMEVSTSKKIPLTLDLASCMPKCDCDVTQLQQIMLNLLTNANEAIGDGKGRIFVRTGSMQVDDHWLALAQESEKAEAGAFVYIEVEDDGKGMSEEVQKRIFEPFFTTKFTGRGLGMSAVQGIMRGHYGILFFQSTEHQGSTFRVAFPVSEAYMEIREQPVPLTASALPHKGMALVVDDESDVRALVCDMLTKLDYEALIAENGKQALEIYALHRDEIEFVVLDLMMPEMNGDECLERLKAMNPDVKIILSSGYSEPLVASHLSQAKEQGMIDELDFLQKPYDIDQLILSIQRLK